MVDVDVNPDEIISELSQWIEEDRKVVSYRWLARHFSIPSNFAKRILSRYSEDHKGSVSTQWLLTGTSKGSKEGGHEVKIVSGDKLEGHKAELGDVISMHVFSVGPSGKRRADATALWEHAHLQAQELLQEGLSGGGSAAAMAFMRNGSSAVSFQPTARAPRPARVFAAEEPAGPAKPPASATTIATVTAVSKAAQASVPSPTQAKKVKPPPAPAGKSNALASMWSKAPVTKSNPQAVEAAAAPQGRESGAAGPPVGSSSADKKKKKKLEEEEEEQVASPAIAKRNKKRAVMIESDDDDEAPPDPAPSAPEATAPPAPSETPPTEEGDGDQEVLASATAGGKKGSKRKAAVASSPASKAANKRGSKGKAGGDDEAREEALDLVGGSTVTAIEPLKDKKPVPTCFAGSATTKPSNAAGGRRRVTKTSYTEKGEEITTEVWMEGDEEVGSPEPKATSVPAQAAILSAPPAVASGKGAAAKSAGAANGAKPATAAKGKNANGAGGQKGIASFFSKKQ